VFFINSEEEAAICPKCGGELEYSSRVVRKLTDKAGNRHEYSIRVMKCVNEACPSKYHRELPDLMIPYRRYDAETIEETIDPSVSGNTAAADESTIRRWRKWYKDNAINILMSLLSVSATQRNEPERTWVDNASLISQMQTPEKAMNEIKKRIGRRTEWLNETIRILANNSKWVFNRSAFLPD